MAQITVRLSDELLGEIDRARALVPRERWVREALKQALGAATEVRHSSARGDVQGDSPPAADSPRTPASARASSAALDRQALLNRAKGL